MTSGRRLVAVGVVFAALVTACGSDDAASPATSEQPRLPPNDVEALAEILDPVVEPLGLHLTRGALIDLHVSYEVSDDGTHLALYVEPTDDFTLDDYVDGIGSVTAMITPLVFERWPGLESYDICQEPPTADDPSDEPFPATQVNLTRAQYDAIEWDGAGTVDVVAASMTDPRGLDLIVSQQVRDSEPYQRAETEARAL